LTSLDNLRQLIDCARVRAQLVRSIVAETLGAFLGGEREADRALDRALRRHRELDSAERAAVARRTLGIACWRGRLDFRLDQACPGWRADPSAFRIGAYVLDQEGGSLAQAEEASGLGAWALAGLEAPVSWPEDAIERLAAERSLPLWLAERFRGEFGVQADALAQVCNLPGPTVLRTNVLKIGREVLRRSLCEEGIACQPTARSPWGLTVEGRANLFGSEAWRQGEFEVQDEGSQLVALAVGATPGERVIDACAGAGGKTLALAAAMENRGEILALDVDPPRLVNLAARVRRAGVTIVRSLRVEPSGAWPTKLGLADRVLVDAPCSSLGTLRRNPDLRWRLAPGSIADFARSQSEILERASRLVRPGGLLVYATCTLTREENQGVAEAFARSHAVWHRIPVGGTDPLMLLPHLHGTDGFFACAWTKPA
jgi:16S rRNA (cytosine967-C5)-methyltransferase